MDKGIWVWPTDPKAQRLILKKVADSPHLIIALQGIAKNQEGLSNSELDELLKDNSNWMTLWSVRQLIALGFIQYKVDLFGGPARYMATDLGKNALATMTGQPTSPKPPAQASAAQPAAPKPV